MVGVSALRTGTTYPHGDKKKTVRLRGESGSA